MPRSAVHPSGSYSKREPAHAPGSSSRVLALKVAGEARKNVNRQRAHAQAVGASTVHAVRPARRHRNVSSKPVSAMSASWVFAQPRERHADDDNAQPIPRRFGLSLYWREKPESAFSSESSRMPHLVTARCSPAKQFRETGRSLSFSGGCIAHLPATVRRFRDARAGFT